MKIFVKSSESILAMSTEKSKLEKRMEAWSDLIVEHLSKCAMYDIQFIDDIDDIYAPQDTGGSLTLIPYTSLQ